MYFSDGYSLCQTPQTHFGVALHVNATISICLSANPFTQITTSNWRFKSTDNDNTNIYLPDGVSISVQDTSHPYEKYVKLIITNVLESHYGIYTLHIANFYNTEELTYIFNLLPEGKSQ